MVKVAGAALFVAGCLVTCVGIWAAGAYLYGVWDVWNEPDRSWLFWGLVFLFLGFFAVPAGLTLAAVGWRLFRR